MSPCLRCWSYFRHHVRSADDPLILPKFNDLLEFLAIDEAVKMLELADSSGGRDVAVHGCFPALNVGKL